MPKSAAPYNLTPENVPVRAKRDFSELLRRGLYCLLIATLFIVVTYFFLGFRANQRRVANLYLTRAKKFMGHDEVDEAAEALKKASLAAPGSRLIQTEQLKARIFQIANQSDSLARQLDFEKLNQAEADCKQLLSEDPGSAELTALLGIIYAHKDQPMLAMETYRKAAEMAPTYANVRNYWGYSAYQWQYPENWEELATQKFNEAKDLDPKYGAPLINLASLYLMKNKFEEAINIFSDVEKIQSNDETLYTMWGIALDNWGRQTANKVEAFEKFAEALEKYRQAESLNPALALIHFNKANALADSGGEGSNRVDDAISEYKKALELDPSIAYAEVAIAQLLIDRQDASLNDLKEAASHLDKAIALTEQTINQYEYRKKTADAHAQKTLNLWAIQRKQEIAIFQKMLQTALGKLSGDGQGGGDNKK